MAHPLTQLDPVIHQQARLAIVSALAGVKQMAFPELKAVTGLTDGNLSTHLSHLEKAEYVQITKTFKGKKPHTTLSLTAEGRDALAKYIDSLQALLNPGGKS